MSVFELVLAAASLTAGAVASVAGFGIGSILTPLLAVQVGTKLAVAAVSVPHLLATALRFWMLKKHVDRRVLLGFGLASAAGGLTGALLHASFGGPLLSLILGGLLLFSGIRGLTGLSQQMHFNGLGAWLAGGLSGMFGGLVGNQGGIRSAAMMTFDIPKESFVATATAIGIFVDAARMPVYLAKEAGPMLAIWPLIALASAGVLAGTIFGTDLLRRVPEKIFRKVLSGLILALGVWMVFEGFRA